MAKIPNRYKSEYQQNRGFGDLENILIQKREIKKELREEAERSWTGGMADRFKEFDGLMNVTLTPSAWNQINNLQEFDPNQIIKEVYGDATEDSDPENRFNNL